MNKLPGIRLFVTSCLIFTGCAEPQPAESARGGATSAPESREENAEMDVRTAVDLAMTYIRRHDEEWDRFDVQIKRMPDGWKLTSAETKEFAIRDPLPACWLVTLSGQSPGDVQMVVVMDNGDVSPLKELLQAKK